MMMKKIIFSILLLVNVTACNDILEKTDLSGVDDRIWDNESTATLYLNRIYDLAMPVYYSMRSATTLPTAIHTISDEANTGDNKPLYGTVSIDNVGDFWGNTSGNAWNYIRRLNILLSDIDKGTMDLAAKNKIKGQAYFLRAWVYFNLVKVYGGVPIITEAQDWQTEDISVPRNKTSECIDLIVNDLDAAVSLLAPGMPATQGNTDRGRITRDAALAIKGRVLLYWASPQFNPTDNADRWNRAYDANKAAYDSLKKHGYALFPSFANVLTDESGTNKEVIMIRTYDGTLRGNTFENGARPFSESTGGGGSFQPTWELVKAFPMKSGLPAMVNGQPANGFDSVRYWKDRDPRFDATIAYNGAVWELSGKTGRKQWNYVDVIEDKSKQTGTGFYCKKGINAKLLPANAPLGTTDWVEMRFAEVMLNLAECGNATNEQTKRDEAFTMLTAIRQRAGISSANSYGLPVGMGREAMAKAIMEERRIEFAFEGKRHDDLRRTRTFHTLNGQRRHALIIKIKAPFKASDLEKKDANGIMLRDKLDINGADYTTYFAPTFTNLDTQFPIKFEEKYYFYGIPTTNLQRNQNLEQTKDWGGTFNPLE